VTSGYSDRLLPRDEACAKKLKKRTLTNLYNQRPTWLDQLHRELDEAVAAAYSYCVISLERLDLIERRWRIAAGNTGSGVDGEPGRP
jgi:hypothetical protein